MNDNCRKIIHIGMTGRGVSAFFSLSLIRICYFTVLLVYSIKFILKHFSIVITHGIKNRNISCICLSIMSALQNLCT